MEKENTTPEKRPLFIGRIILAFIIATIIFVAGFLLSYEINYSKVQSIGNTQEIIRYDLLSLQLQREILTSSCENFNYAEFSTQLDNAASIMGILEDRLGKNNSDVLEQKKSYSVLETEHFLLVTDYDKKCNNSIPTILFFYSNNPNDSDQADKMGYILSDFKKNNHDVMVYSFDFNLDSDIISTLKTKYNINQSNTIVINEKVKITSLNNINDLTKAFTLSSK